MNSDIFISIAIPFYYKNKYSLSQLIRCVNSIKLQTFKNYEIVISTQNEYEKLINNKFLKDVKILNAALVKGFIQGNTNNAMNFCCGEWIKIMFSDDFLNNKDDLEKISLVLRENNKSWAILDSLHFNKKHNKVSKPIFSFFNKNILEINTIGSPSAIVLKNDNPILFDTNTWMRLDTDFYYSLFKKYGKPLKIKNVFVINEIHPNQFSNLLINKSQKTRKLLREEKDYLYKKHKYKKMSNFRLIFFKIKIHFYRRLCDFLFRLKNFFLFKN